MGQFDIPEVVIPVQCPVRWRDRNTHQRTVPDERGKNAHCLSLSADWCETTIYNHAASCVQIRGAVDKRVELNNMYFIETKKRY